MPRGREKIDCQMPGAGIFFCANARGCPGGMVRVGIEREIIHARFSNINERTNI